MKQYIKITTIIIICFALIGNIIANVVYAAENGEEEQSYPITLTGNYNYGDEKITLEWTGMSDENLLAENVKVGDYVDYPITTQKAENNLSALSTRIKNSPTRINRGKTQWRVIYNDGETIKLVSTGTLVSTTFPAKTSGWGGTNSEDYGWKNANPYSYGDSKGDGGGFGVYYQIDQIAKCFADYTYASSVRALDIADLKRSEELENLQEYLGQTEKDDISIEIREEGYEEIADTSTQGGGWLGFGGTRNYSSTVATITDDSGLYTGGKFFIPNYYNSTIEQSGRYGNDKLNAVYYVDDNEVKLHRTYKQGQSITAGIKAVVTLKTGLYKIAGDGSEENPWEISTKPGQGKYTVYQKSEFDTNYTAKGPTENTTMTLEGAKDGIVDRSAPDKPNATMTIIKGDDLNLKLTTKAGDTGTIYYHYVTAKTAKEEYSSNEISTIVATGVKGFAYCIDDKPDTDPGNKIQYKAGEEIKIEKSDVNVGKYIHIKAIDYAGNESEILHFPLNYTYRDLNLFKTYQEASDFDDNGVAGTPGWNYVNIDWNPIEIEVEELVTLPDIVLVLDESGSMFPWWYEDYEGSLIDILQDGAKALVTKLLNNYPGIRIGIVGFGSKVYQRCNFTSDKTALFKAIDALNDNGLTNTPGGITKATEMLLKTENTNRLEIIMTDGIPTEGGTETALQRARDNGVTVMSILIEGGTSAKKIFEPYSDSCYIVDEYEDALYDTIVDSLYKSILETMIPRYTTYRISEGELEFSIIQDGTTDVNYDDSGASDKAGPSRPIVTLSETADRDGNIKMDLWAEDRGTSYEFYVKFVNPVTGKEMYSNANVQEIKTGVKGFAWSITDNKTDDPGSEIKPLQFTFGKEYHNKWLHIRAIDHAGNPGEICHIKIETSRYITWEELNSTDTLFCVEYGRTIPAREAADHLNAVVATGDGQYAIREVVANPQDGDRIGTVFVEGEVNTVYTEVQSYSLAKYEISSATPAKRPGKEGNATEQEAYILNYYKQNNSLESFVQKAMYSTEVSKDNLRWTWEETEESEALLAEANAYASYKRRGYEFSNTKLDTSVYMDEEYKDVIIGPFILNYEPQGIKYEDSETQFSGIIGMKVYNQNNEVIAELDKNGNNVGNIEVEFIYTGQVTASKRYEDLFTREKYKFPVGDEEFYIKIKYEKDLENVTNINKIDFIHNHYAIDAQYNVLEGKYNKITWTPNRSSSENTIWCRETEYGAQECIHGYTRKHLVGSYFWLEAKVNKSSRNMPSQKIIDVLWVKDGYQNLIQTLEPGTGKIDPEYPSNNEFTNEVWRLVMDISGNVWHDGMEDQNDGIKANVEKGIEKVKVNIYQVDKYGTRTGITYSTYTDNVGNYTFKDVKRGIYELEFIYNGQIYKSTKVLVNGNAVDYKNDLTHTKYVDNSITEETKEARTELNNAFAEIAPERAEKDKKDSAENGTAIGGRGNIGLTYVDDVNKATIQTTKDGYTKSEFEIKASTVTNNIYFPVSNKKEIASVQYIKVVDSRDVNLGLVQRYTTDINLRSDLYEVIFSMKGNKQSYIFSEKNIRDINSNIEKDEYVQEINRADYNWKLQDLLDKAVDANGKPDQDTINRLLEILGNKEKSEMEVYLDYMIVIRNDGEKDKVQIAELANYFSTDLEYLKDAYRDFEMNSWVQVKYDDVKEGENRNKTDKIEIKWETTSKYSGVTNVYSDEYKKIYTTGLDREELQVQKGEFLEIHIVFRVTKDTNDKVQLDENNAGKVSMTEINGYKTYYIQDGSVAGLIDIDSRPGNANPKEERKYQEDDEDKSPSLKLKLQETANSGGSIDEGSGDTGDINKDENNNIVGYGNVIEGNVWEDLKTSEYVEKLSNNQIISDGIRQDDEPLIQKVKVELIEYFKHPTDSSKDVYLKIGTQETRTVLSLSNGKKMDGGYSFINLPAGEYYTEFTYGDTEQLLAETEKNYTGKVYTGIDFKGVTTEDIYSYEELNKKYDDVELILVADISGSMNGESNKQIKEKATTIVNGISSKLPGVKIGLVSFNNVAKVISKPQENINNILKAIQNLGTDNETAIGYGIETAANNYSENAREKIMVVLTDSEETVQNVEQVIKTIEIATDEKNIDLVSILTKNNYEIFGKPSTLEGNAEPRRGEVYSVYNFSEEALSSVYEKVVELSQTEHLRSSARDDENTRVALIEKYKEMGLEEVEETDVSKLVALEGEERIKAATEYAAQNKMIAHGKTITFGANNVKNKQIHEINLALMERPLTKLIIESEIVSIKVVLPDNTVLIDTAKGISKNVNGLDAEMDPITKEIPPITIYMDEEIMHGSTLIVEYKVKLTNKGEIDRLSNYLKGGSTETVTTSASLILNYTSKNMLYRDENAVAGGTGIWDTVEINDVKDMIVDEAEDAIEDNDLNIYQTKGFAVELYPEGSPEVLNGTGKSSAEFRITLSKILTSQNEEEDLTFDSSLEIVRRTNTAGRPSYTEKPGDFVPDTSLVVDEKRELDSVKERKIIITKPWGGNRSNRYIIIALATLTATAGGILLLKQKQKKKEE